MVNQQILDDVNVELDRIYEVVMPLGGMILKEGRKALQVLVAKENLPFPISSYDEEDFERANPDNFASGVWYWKVLGNGEYVGTFPKRYAKWLWNEHNIQLSNEQRTEIGQITRRFTEESETQFIDFTRHFHWDEGDFGDTDSCFFSEEESEYLQSLYQWSILGLRIFGSGVQHLEDYPTIPAKRWWQKYQHGESRCWVATSNTSESVPQNSLIVFNGYSKKVQNATLHMARVLANFTNLSYRRISLLVNGEHDGDLWINKTKTSTNSWMPVGFLIGDVATLEKYEDDAIIDLTVDTL